MKFNTYNKYIRFIFTNRGKKIRKGFLFGTPIVVLDMKTKEIFEFASISEAARYFSTYPKTIWRIVYGHKLYLNRYQITVGNSYNNKLYAIIYVNFLKSIYKVFKNNRFFIVYMLLSMILIAMLYIFMYYVILVCKETYSEYIVNMNSIKANYYKCVIEHSFASKNSIVNASKSSVSMDKISRFVEVNKGWKLDANFGIYQCIISEINLDFSSTTYSVYTSPIIERIDLNSVFNNLVIKTAPITEFISNNSLSINSNRNSLTLNTSIDGLINRPRNTELLNYQSNILYLLINKLSPSIY